MWYYNGEIIKTPKSMNFGNFQYTQDLFKDVDKLAELGIKPYREVRLDSRYWNNSLITRSINTQSAIVPIATI